jgi:hypothetical protein
MANITNSQMSNVCIWLYFKITGTPENVLRALNGMAYLVSCRDSNNKATSQQAHILVLALFQNFRGSKLLFCLLACVLCSECVDLSCGKHHRDCERWSEYGRRGRGLSCSRGFG